MVSFRVPGSVRPGQELAVSGRMNGQDWSTRVPMQGGGQARGLDVLWARHRIQALTQGLSRGAHPEEVRAEVTRLGLHHHIVTDHTSLVALDQTQARPEATASRDALVPVKQPHGWDLALPQPRAALPQTATPAGLLLRLGAALLLLALALGAWATAGAGGLMDGAIEAGRARGLGRVLAVLIAAAALINLGSGGYILAKAQVAQWLLASAWDRTLAGETQVRPWPWADTWPVARLDLGPKGGRVLVLAGASGRTLAFGPGHLGSTPLPGAGGNSAIAGHRDTHFAALADLAPGDRLWVEIPGRTLGYRVTETRVVDQAEVGVLADRGHEGLTLITCYPFDALIPGGPLRFVVFAESR